MSNYNYNYTVPNYSVPSNQNSWRNNNIPQGQSQPAAPLHTSRGSTIRETYPVYPVANSTSQYSAEFLNDKVEQLEKEKIHLNFILLQLNEREGRNVKKIEQLEFDLEDCKSKYIRLSSSLEESREQTRASNEQAKILKEGKEELFLAVLNLNERIEMQNKTAQEAQTIWAKLPAAIKALKRLDDEAVKLRREKTSTDAEKEALARSVAQLQETAEETLIEMTKLKSKMDIERNNLNSTTKSLEEATLATVNLRQNVEELKALNLREKTSFHSERNSLLDELERLRNQLATRSSILESMNTPTKDDPEMDFNGKQHFLEFMDDLKHNLLKSEMKRKQLHNALQELRGNIRVFVRTRPFLSMDGDEQFDDNIDPLIGGCIKFYRDTTSVSLVKGPNERDKPQARIISFHFKIIILILNLFLTSILTCVLSNLNHLAKDYFLLLVILISIRVTRQFVSLILLYMKYLSTDFQF